MSLKKSGEEEGTNIFYETNPLVFKKLHNQLKEMANRIGDSNFLYENYCQDIALNAAKRGSNINNIIGKKIYSCKNTLKIYERIIECDVFNPEKNRRLKGKKMIPLVLYLIAEEIVNYPRLKGIDGVYKYKTYMREELDRLKKNENDE